MNSTDQSFANGSAIYDEQPIISIHLIVEYTSVIIHEYINRIICGFGILLNWFFLRLLLVKRRRLKAYSYLWCRSFCNFTVCIFGIIPKTSFNIETRYKIIDLIIFFLTNAGIRIFLCASVISDILMILNRFWMLKERRNAFLAEISIKLNLTICFGISFITMMPFLLVPRMIESETEDLYYFNFTKNIYTEVYILGLFLIEAVIPVFIISVLNIYSIVKFRKIVNLRNTTETRQIELKYTKLVLILTSICIITRTIDLCAGIFYRSEFFKIYAYSPGDIILINFFREFAFCLLYCSHAFENFFYLFMDRHIRQTIIEYIHKF